MTIDTGNIGILPSEYIEQQIPRITELLRRAELYNPGEYTIDDIFDGIRDQEYVLWGEVIGENQYLKSIAIVNPLFFPRKRVLNLMVVVSDDMRIGIERFLELIESFAADHGFQALRLGGRPGWGRVLKRFGFSEPYRILEKEISKWSA